MLAAPLIRSLTSASARLASLSARVCVCRRKKKCSMPKSSSALGSSGARLRHRNARHGHAAAASASETLDSIREGVPLVSARALLAADALEAPADSSPGGTPPCEPETSESHEAADGAAAGSGSGVGVGAVAGAAPTRKNKPTAKCMPTLYIPPEAHAPADDEDEEEEEQSTRVRRFIEAKNRLLPHPDVSQVLFPHLLVRGSSQKYPDLFNILETT